MFPLFWRRRLKKWQRSVPSGCQASVAAVRQTAWRLCTLRKLKILSQKVPTHSTVRRSIIQN
eukprot:2294947-Pleurochrysis_carterae.AAC.1